MANTIEVVDRGERISFSFEDVLKYHGPRSPGASTLGWQALKREMAGRVLAHPASVYDATESVDEPRQ
jgi:hypothetical protein